MKVFIDFNLAGVVVQSSISYDLTTLPSWIQAPNVPKSINHLMPSPTSGNGGP